MAQHEFRTADDVLIALRRRRPVCQEVQVERASTASSVLVAFETRMQHRHDLGVLNRVCNLLLESHNPFEPQKARRPKMEAVIFGTLLALVVASVVFFNLSAPRVEVLP